MTLKELIKLGSVNRHPRIFYAHAVGFEGLNSLQHHLSITSEPLLCRQVDLDQINREAGAHELLQNAFEGNLCHLVTVQYHQRLFDLYFGAHVTLPESIFRWAKVP